MTALHLVVSGQLAVRCSLSTVRCQLFAVTE